MMKCGNLSRSNQPPRSTQSGHPSVGRRSEYRSKGGDALRLGERADLVLFAGNTVWSISERVRGVCVDTLYKLTFKLLYGMKLIGPCEVLLLFCSESPLFGCHHQEYSWFLMAILQHLMKTLKRSHSHVIMATFHGLTWFIWHWEQ